MLILIHLILLSYISWRLYQHYAGSTLRLYYWPGLLLKLVAGLLLGMLYFFYYQGGDTVHYHQDAAALAALAYEDLPAYVLSLTGNYPEGLQLHYLEQERAMLTAKIFSVFYVFTASNYWITACYLSFLAFASLFLMVKRLVLYRPALQKPAALAFLFWPSFVFWTSGLLKESLSIICIAFIVATFLPYLFGNVKVRLRELLIAILLFLLLFYIKYYYAAMLAPILLCLLAAVWLGRRFHLRKFLVWGIFLLALVGGVAAAMQLHPNLWASRFPEVWISNYFLMVEISEPGAYVEFEKLQADWRSILRNVPKAIAAGLYAPLYPFDWTNILRLLASAENIVLLLFSLSGLLGWILQQRARISLYGLATLIYILAFALFISIAAPNYGTLLRYRISYHPFFVLLMLTATFQLISWLRRKGRGT